MDESMGRGGRGWRLLDSTAVGVLAGPAGPHGACRNSCQTDSPSNAAERNESTMQRPP